MSERFYSQQTRSNAPSNTGVYTGKGSGSQDFAIVGLSELNKALDEFPDKIQRNVMRGAMRAALRVVQIEARARVPVWLGQLRSTIRISVRIRDGVVTGQLKAGSRVRGGSRKEKGQQGAFYAHMVEFGTAAHFIRASKNRFLKIGAGFFAKVVAHPGSQPRPFMRPAIAAKAQAASDAFGDYIRARLDKLNQADND